MGGFAPGSQKYEVRSQKYGLRALRNSALCPLPSALTSGYPSGMQSTIDFIHTNRDRYVTELKQYLAIPSISALPAHAADVRKCAEWTAEEMRRIQLENVRLIDTPGNPRRLRRMAASAGRADDPVLRPLRRAARRSRSTSGNRRRSKRPCATARSTRAAPPTTRARSSCTSRPSRRT